MCQVGTKIASPPMLWQWNGRTCQLRGAIPGDDFYATTAVTPSEFVAVTTAPE